MSATDLAAQKFKHIEILAAAPLRDRARRAGIALIRFYDVRRNGAAYPSIETLADAMQVSVNVARDARNELEAAGLITVEPSKGRAPNLVYMAFPTMEELAKVEKPRSSNPTPRSGGFTKASTLQISHENEASTLHPGVDPSPVEIPVGDGPPQGAPSTSAPSSAVVEDLRKELSELPPVGAVETGTALRADPVPGEGDPDTPAAADPSQKIDAMGSERFTSEPLPSASAPSIDESDDEDLDDLDEDTPALERFRRENDGDYPADTGELQLFAEAHGIAVTHADRAELRRTLKWIADADRISEDEDDELAIRPIDEDDLRRLRAGVGIDQFGRPIVVSDSEVNASVMLADPLRRARFVGRTCDVLSEKQPRDRTKFWSATCSRLHASIRSAGHGTAIYDELIQPFSTEVRTEMSRRDAAFRDHFRRASA